MACQTCEAIRKRMQAVKDEAKRRYEQMKKALGK